MDLARSYLRYQVNIGFTEVLFSKPSHHAAVTEKDVCRGQGNVAESPVPRKPSRAESSTELDGGPESLEAIRELLGECTRCPLHEQRRTIVFGEGNPQAQLMFVGEGPGADEDRQARPFVGKAGQLLTRMIRAMHLDRADVYIASVVKCRPPNNREPHRQEIHTCLPFLEAQIAAVKPNVIVALGKVAATTLLDTQEPISRLRGRFHVRNGVHVMPTYHPSYLLRAEPDKRPKAETWADLQMVMSLLDSLPPARGDVR